MLVRFDSKAGTITMFGEVAKQLLRMMGQSGQIPGAILASDIPAALDRLRKSLAGEAPPRPRTGDDGEGERPVQLQQRAYPLIELFERAHQHNQDVIWDQERRTIV